MMIYRKMFCTFAYLYVFLFCSSLAEMPAMSTLAGNATQSNVSNVVNRLRIGAWNMHCNTDIAGPYLNEMAKYCQIIATSEHGLYENQLHKLDNMVPGYKSFALPSAHLDVSSSSNRPGIGGTAILWNSDLFAFRVKPLPGISSDRMTVIELTADDAVYYIISVYLPHQTCNISDYDIELNKLKLILDECIPKGYCIVIGDTNTHFPAGYDIRTWGVPNRNTPKLHSMVQSYDMYIADLGYKARGPNVTFMGGNGSSYVDHVIVPKCLIPNITDCFVSGDCISNVSDHSSVCIELAVSINPSNASDPNGRRVAWGKMTEDEIHDKYTDPLEQEVIAMWNELGYNVTVPDDIDNLDLAPSQAVLDSFVAKFSNAIKAISDKLVKNTFKKHQKPWWNDDLSALSNAKRQARAAWVSAGKQKHLREYDVYKEAKKAFRKELRRYKYEYELKAMNDFLVSQDIDARYFWYLVNRSKRVKVASPVMSNDGIILTDPDAIRDDWTSYYESLYTEGSEEKYDDRFKETVEKELAEMKNNLPDDQKLLSGGKIESSEVSSLIKKLKRNKAAGWDRITAEELIHAGPLSISSLTWLFNSIVNQSSIPIALKKGLLVPIPKPEKDSSIKDNNRGITLLPLFYKLLEKMIIEREQEFFSDPNVIDPAQSSGKEKCSCLHSSFVVQETVAYYRNMGCAVHGGGLDSRKAFDTVWINGMMYKLHRAGMNGAALRLIDNAYSNFSCAVYLDGKTGRWFTPMRGVHQGAPLSMILYVIYVNDMIVELRISGKGIIICNINVTSPCHADDIFLLALYKTHMNHLLRIAYSYSFKWRSAFNFDKTKYLMWGNDNDPGVDIQFGGEIIEPSDFCKHMGIHLCTKQNGLNDMIELRAGKVRTVLAAAQGIGNHEIPVPPTSLSKVYWAVGVPKLTYGLDVTPVNDSCMKQLEEIHRQNARRVQSLPSNTHNPAPLATLGWMSMSAHIAVMKIMFIVRTLCLPIDSMYRQLLVSRLEMVKNVSCDDVKFVGPALSCWDCVRKYDLEDAVMPFVDLGDPKNVLSTKRIVKARVKEIEHDRWRYTCMLYPGLDIYLNVVSEIRMNAWWKFVQMYPHFMPKVSAVVSVIMNNQPRSMQCNFDSDICQLCVFRSIDSQSHILFHCEALHTIRQTYMSRLINSMPPAMVDSFNNLSMNEKLVFMLTGTDVEFYDVMKNVANFVYALYQDRKRMYDIFSE